MGTFLGYCKYRPEVLECFYKKINIIVRLMTSISKGKNTPIVLKDKISLKSKLIKGDCNPDNKYVLYERAL